MNVTFGGARSKEEAVRISSAGCPQRAWAPGGEKHGKRPFN